MFRRGRKLASASSLSLILFAGMNPIPASDKPLLRLGPVLGLSGGCIMIIDDRSFVVFVVCCVCVALSFMC